MGGKFKLIYLWTKWCRSCFVFALVMEEKQQIQMRQLKYVKKVFGALLQINSFLTIQQRYEFKHFSSNL